MQKSTFKLFALFIFCLLLGNSVAVADGFFPFPKGNVYVTNGYGGSKTHQGGYYYSLDFRSYNNGNACDSYGAPVLAAREGVVSFVDKTGTKENKYHYGNNVIVRHADNTTLRYAHMIKDSIAVNVGDTVVAGQILGLLGDTGHTDGMICQAFDGENVGAHLHFESRDADNAALKPEPLNGQENYTDISKAGNPYISTTLMYDPANQWGKYAGKVPYRLTYNPSAIHSLFPLTVQVGATQVFTITGESLMDDLSAALSGCRGITWISREADKQEFSCTMAGSQGVKNGFIRFVSGSKPDFQFGIQVVSGLDKRVPAIVRAEAVNPLADTQTSFTVEGENLPDDLALDFPECTELNFKTISPSRREFSCRLPHTVYGGDGNRVNGMHTFNTRFASASTGYSYPLSFSADYQVVVESLSPLVTVAGRSSVFTFTGRNLNLAKAVFIESCDRLNVLEQTSAQIKVQCTPQKSNAVWYYFTPDILHQDFRRVILKDKPNGTTLFNFRIVVADSAFIKSDEKSSEKDVNDKGGVEEKGSYVTLKGIPNDFIKECGEELWNVKNNEVNNIFKTEGHIKREDTAAFYAEKIDWPLFQSLKRSKEYREYSIALSQKQYRYTGLIVFYRWAAERLGWKEIDFDVGENDIIYRISLDTMKSMLDKGYFFSFLIDSHIDNGMTHVIYVKDCFFD